MYFKPGTDIPLFGNPDAVQLDSDSNLVASPKSIKIMSNSSNIPLVRLDTESHHGKPKNHLQFGANTYTGRSGEEAKDLFSHIILKKIGVDINDEL